MMSHKLEKTVIFKNLVICVLVIIFTMEAYTALQRLMEGKTAVSYTIKDDGRILFPSVSICKMLPFEKYSIQEFDNKSLTLDEVKEVFTREVLNKSDVIHFVTHADTMNLTFPCKTTPISEAAGAPCAFPFVFRDCQLYYDPQEHLIKYSK